jgi:pyruvate,water dikinase
MSALPSLESLPGASRLPAIAPLAGAGDAARFGGKASHLARLAATGYPVPAGFALAHDADTDQPDTLLALRTSLAELGDVALAVRSSAVGEDGADAAFAGIYASVLDVRGEAAVLAAIASVRASGSSARALAYRESVSAAQMGVVVQHLAVRSSRRTVYGRSGDRRSRDVRGERRVGPGRGAGLGSR